MTGQRCYEFGRFRLDAAGPLLFHEGQVVSLPPKEADALLLLLENAGNVVEKEELYKRLWPDTFVGESSLTRTISLLRRTLTRNSKGQQYICTISKRGYRFVVPVREGATAPGRSAAGKAMLAVLPFENLSQDEKQEYLSDGLTEEMITQLGRLSPERLGVIARTSAMQFKHSKLSVQQIGRELGVAFIVEGSVRRVQNRVRITAQLIQVCDQTHLWAGTYDRRLGDILAVEASVARAVAREIQIKLAPHDETRLASARPVNAEAYEAYLQGRYLWNRRTREALENSVRYFEKAIRIDPDYAPAYAGLADSHLTLQDDGHLWPPDATAAAKQAAARALQIDEKVAEAHTSLAHAHLHEFTWADAEREFKRAIALNPSYPAAHFYYANYLVAKGRSEEAIAEARSAQMLDPVSLPAGSNMASILYHAQQFDQAIEQSMKVLDMDPNFARAHEDLGRAYEAKEMYPQAVRSLRKAVVLSRRNPTNLASLAHALGVSGMKKEALSALEEIQRLARKRYVPAYAFAIVAIGLADKDGAFAWLEKACFERSSSIPFLKVNPRLVSLHSDPRFERLLRLLGLQS
jgi:TolB-like protein/Flp pilus assembly protein TadD